MTGRDPTHWLHRLSPDEWIRAGMRELASAKASAARRAIRPALASARRAAGMGWNAVLALEPHENGAYGRTYVEHLVALAEGRPLETVDPTPIPDEVRLAARRLLDDPAAGRADVVQLVTPRRDGALLDAAETILAEAYARVVRRAAASLDRQA
jgi:hypothetical protein